MDNIRVRTTVNGEDNFIKVNLKQDFDFIEVLSLKISQEDVYRKFSSDYGIVVGRVIVNNGVGVPNAKVSIFISVDESDKNNEELLSLYPFKTIQDTDNEGRRYNLLPNEYQSECHTPVGTFPSKTVILDNSVILDIYEKYYSFTTTTNSAGDFMLYGVPVGNHLLHVDVDVSDIGIFSQRPYDYIEQGAPEKNFMSPTKFKDGKNLNNLSQLKHQRVGVNVIPFWGESLANEVGITRVDVDLNYNLQPKAIFMGSIFGDSEKNSVNKNCRPRKDLGRLCETVTSEGSVEMIRQTIDGSVERFDVEGGRVIDADGSWAYQVPMNLDYMVTDEFGNLVPTEDTTRGIPTRARVRFRVGMDNTGGEGRLRTRAKYLVPHNPSTSSDLDYSFGEETSDEHFRDLYWNKIYTVRNHITRIQSNCGVNCPDNRKMLGIKDVDNCVGEKNPFPFNRLDGDFNPLFSVICIILGIIITILSIINGILSFINGIRIPVIKVYPFRKVKCVAIECDGTKFAPGCSSDASPSGTGDRSADNLHECYKMQLAESLNVYEFDFYNDWVNGTLYSFLLKYKKRKKREKYCSTDKDTTIHLVDTLTGSDLKSYRSEKLNRGIIKKFEDELYYSAMDSGKEYLLYATDITNLGSVFNCDWQGMPSIHDYLTPTTYNIPPFQINDEPDVTSIANDGKPDDGLLFNLTCVKLTTNSTQNNNIKRICEIGVGLDENRQDEGGLAKDGVIDNEDIENKFVRDSLIFLNEPNSSGVFPLTSEFDGSDYQIFRNSSNRYVNQNLGNSLYFYFGTSSNKNALEKMNSKYFTKCEQYANPQFIIEGVVVDVTTIGGSDGSIELEIIGSDGPFTFEWSNGEDTANIYNLEPGQYTVYVTDPYDNIVRRTFTVLEPQPLRVNTLSGMTSQEGASDGKIYLNSINGGSGDYTVTLTGPSGTFTVTNPLLIYEFTGLIAGDYTITIVDNNGIVPNLTETVVVIDPPLLIFSVIATPSECNIPNTSKLEVKINSGVPPYTIVTTATLADSTTYTSNTMVQYDLSAATYTTTVVDAIGQTGSESRTFDQIPTLNIEIASTIVNPYRVKIPTFLPDTYYEFWKIKSNGDWIMVGEKMLTQNQVYLHGEEMVYEYGDDPETEIVELGWVIGDIIFARERDNGCDSIYIKITSSGYVILEDLEDEE